VVPPLPHLPQGWYLIYWRAISVDGHPVQGAFTYAVGPNPGPAPQFPVPSIAGSATSLRLLIARWVMFLSVLSAIGLFVFRIPDRPTGNEARAGQQPAGGDARVRDRLGGRTARDPVVPRHRDRDRFAAVRIRRDRARAAVPGDRVRARLRRHARLPRPVLPGRVDGRMARSADPRNGVGRRGHLTHWCARGRQRGPVAQAVRGTRRRPRHAGSRSRWTGCIC